MIQMRINAQIQSFKEMAIYEESDDDQLCVTGCYADFGSSSVGMHSVWVGTYSKQSRLLYFLFLASQLWPEYFARLNVHK